MENLKATCGFLSPADEYIESILDLNEHLILRPVSTFFMRVKGDALRGIGVYQGDLLIVDRGTTAGHGDIVLAVIDGEFYLRKYIRRNNRIWLCPENPKYQEILVEPEMAFEIWGVVLHCIHSFRAAI